MLHISVCQLLDLRKHKAIDDRIDSPGGDNVILLTGTRVLSFWSKRLRLDWELPFSQVQGVTVEDTGIRFAHKMGKEQDKFAFIPDKVSQSWFFNQVAAVVKSYNARRRMDAWAHEALYIHLIKQINR